MKRSSLVIFCFFIALLASSSSWAADDRPKIMAAAVKDAPNQEIVRLVIAPAVDKLESKVVCGNGSYWVRLPQIANLEKAVHNLPIEEASSFARVRLAPKNDADSTVVQIIPRDHSLAVCEQIAVMSLGGEIAVAVPLTEADKRRKARFAAISEQIEKNPLKAEADSSKHAVKEEKTDVKKEEAPKQPSETKKLTEVLSRTTGSDSQTPVNAKKEGEVATAQGIDIGRAMIAFGFAALLAGMAFYLKKRKGKVSLDDPDTIDIISSKRLGPKQQLVLASVQGTRFLLAIADKTVTTLGMLPEKGGAAPARQRPLPSFQAGSAPGSLQVVRETPPQPAPAPMTLNQNSHTDVHDLLKEMLKQKTIEQEPSAKPQAAVPSQVAKSGPVIGPTLGRQMPPAAPRPAISTKQAVDFQEELQNAFQAAGHSGEIDRNTSETTSNVAGLIAMARARAGLRPRPSDPYEPRA